MTDQRGSTRVRMGASCIRAPRPIPKPDSQEAQSAGRGYTQLLTNPFSTDGMMSPREPRLVTVPVPTNGMAAGSPQISGGAGGFGMQGSGTGLLSAYSTIHAAVASPSKLLPSWIAIAAWALYAIFLFGLPLWSNYFNDRLEFFNFQPHLSDSTTGHLCTTAPDNMLCTNGKSFLLISEHRRAISGRTNVGCGCGQGVFGEGLCPSDPSGFTISTFISTTPALGAFAFLSMPLLIVQYWAIQFLTAHLHPQHILRIASLVSYIIFLISYCSFWIMSACIFPRAHVLLSQIFVFMGAIHSLLLAYICFVNLHGKLGIRIARVSVVLMVVGIGAFILAIIIRQVPHFMQKVSQGLMFRDYMFYLGESVGLTCLMGLGPLLHAVL